MRPAEPHRPSPDDVIADAGSYFDKHTYGATPTAGKVTQTDTMKDWTLGGGTQWVTSSRAGFDLSGRLIIEFHLQNASTMASAAPNPTKIFKYSAGGLAGDGNDGAPGEKWLQQDVTWREPIRIWVPPQPMPSAPGTTSPQVLGTPNPTPGPEPS